MVIKGILGLIILAAIVAIWIIKTGLKVGQTVYDGTVGSQNLGKTLGPTSRHMSAKASSVVEACCQLLGVQLTLGGPNATEILQSDHWALGYVYGFHDGIMQRMGVRFDLEGLAVFGASYIGLFGDPDIAGTLFARSVDLQETSTFQKGAAVGGQEAFNFFDKESSPLALSDYLRKASAGVSPSRHSAIQAPTALLASQKMGVVATTIEELHRPSGEGSAMQQVRSYAERKAALAPNRLFSTWWAVGLGLVVVGGTGALLWRSAPIDAREAATTQVAATSIARPSVVAATESIATPSSEVSHSAQTASEGPNVAGTSTQQAQPSFDCAKAGEHAEFLLCSDDYTAALDRQLAALYADLLRDAASPDMLRSDQRRWLRDIRDGCQDLRCLIDAYAERIRVFSNASAVAVETGVPVIETDRTKARDARQ